MFGICLAVVVAAVGWMSVRALEADDAEAAARRQAALEENAQLALWRMDSAMAPLVAQESTRPYFAYQSFYNVGRAPQASKGKPVAAPPIPSPLLADCPKEVLLHFQIDADNHFSSPRVPDAALRSKAIPQFLSAANARLASQRLDRIRALIRPADFQASLPPLAVPPKSVAAATPILTGVPAPTAENAPAMTTIASGTLSFYPTANGRDLSETTNQSSVPSQTAEAQHSQIVTPQFAPAQSPNPALGIQQVPNAPEFSIQTDNAPNEPAQQKLAGGKEFNARSQYVAQNYQMANTLNTANGNGDALILGNGSSAFTVAPPADNNVSTGSLSAADAQTSVMKPLWISDQLILARRVRVGDRQFVQGCLLDWSAIQSQLLASVKDLLPGAKLSPVQAATAAESAHLLASLPVRLELGEVAVAALLQGVMSLSERRGAFVSAVTHELRTPLTTFRMYAEMLADNMVPEESRRKSYLETLRVEADRLAHLVENVLLYARLERGRPSGRIAATSVSEVIDHSLGRLTDRARQANFTIVVEADQAARERRVLADPAVVEQILFNLVDNACKYAAVATDRTLLVEARSTARHVELTVRDHGPGVGSDQLRVLFQPFRKSAQDAAATAPGVGLGLALCRRLARDMGGELFYTPDPTAGARFTLRLKLA
jgi:signal transduction histidine kinase